MAQIISLLNPFLQGANFQRFFITNPRYPMASALQSHANLSNGGMPQGRLMNTTVALSFLIMSFSTSCWQWACPRGVSPKTMLPDTSLEVPSPCVQWKLGVWSQGLLKRARGRVLAREPPRCEGLYEAHPYNAYSINSLTAAEEPPTTREGTHVDI